MDAIYALYIMEADIPQPEDKFHNYVGPAKSEAKKYYRESLQILKEGLFRSKLNIFNDIDMRAMSMTYHYSQTGQTRQTIR